MFKEEFSFYTFVSEKRLTKQEKESSIHRLAVSLTGELFSAKSYDIGVTAMLILI